MKVVLLSIFFLISSASFATERSYQTDIMAVEKGCSALLNSELKDHKEQVKCYRSGLRLIVKEKTYAYYIPEMCNRGIDQAKIKECFEKASNYLNLKSLNKINIDCNSATASNKECVHCLELTLSEQKATPSQYQEGYEKKLNTIIFGCGFTGNYEKEAKCFKKTMEITSSGKDYKEFILPMCSELEDKNSVKCFKLAVAELGSSKDRWQERKCSSLSTFFSRNIDKEKNCYINYFKNR